MRKKAAEKVITEKRIGLDNLTAPKGARKKKKLLGRGSGSGHGKTSTRGSKGQTSRAGRHTYLGFEGGQSPLIRRFPKRGFNSGFARPFQVVNIREIAKIKDAVINAEVLLDKGIIKSKLQPVKILGIGEIKVAKTVAAQAFSKQAADKIKNAGGKIEVVNA